MRKLRSGVKEAGNELTTNVEMLFGRFCCMKFAKSGEMMDGRGDGQASDDEIDVLSPGFVAVRREQRGRICAEGGGATVPRFREDGRRRLHPRREAELFP